MFYGVGTHDAHRDSRVADDPAAMLNAFIEIPYLFAMATIFSTTSKLACDQYVSPE